MKRPSLGQNFLVDRNVAKKIVDAAGIKPGDRVVEIGPGRGILTRLILSKTRNLTAVEIDKKLSADLRSSLEKEFPEKYLAKFRLVTGDFLEYNPRSVPKYISNLPYYAASPIIKKAISSPSWKLGIFTVQKEVAERITASAGGDSYGILTLQIAYFARATRLFVIGRNCFLPAPEVDSAVILLQKKQGREKAPYPRFNRIITAAFSQRRKTILNSLSSSLGLSKKNVENILIAHKIPPSLRAEQVPFEKFIRITLDMKNVF